MCRCYNRNGMLSAIVSACTSWSPFCFYHIWCSFEETSSPIWLKTWTCFLKWPVGILHNCYRTTSIYVFIVGFKSRAWMGCFFLGELLYITRLFFDLCNNSRGGLGLYNSTSSFIWYPSIYVGIIIAIYIPTFPAFNKFATTIDLV